MTHRPVHLFLLAATTLLLATVATAQPRPTDPSTDRQRLLAQAEAGLAASPPGDFTVVLRVLRWPGGDAAVEAAVRACGGSSGPPAYSGRFERLGVPIEARGVLVLREGEALLLESEAPVAKVAFATELYDRWVRQVTDQLHD